MRRTPRDGQRARLLKGQRRRLVREEWRSGDRHTRERSMSEAKRCVQSGWFFDHHARCVAARRARVAWVLAKHIEHVAEVEAHRAHAQERLGITER